MGSVIVLPSDDLWGLKPNVLYSVPLILTRLPFTAVQKHPYACICVHFFSLAKSKVIQNQVSIQSNGEGKQQGPGEDITQLPVRGQLSNWSHLLSLHDLLNTIYSAVRKS